VMSFEFPENSRKFPMACDVSGGKKSRKSPREKNCESERRSQLGRESLGWPLIRIRDRTFSDAVLIPSTAYARRERRKVSGHESNPYEHCGRLEGRIFAKKN